MLVRAYEGITVTSQMDSARHSAVRVLQLMMVASLVLPAILFAYSSWVNYLSVHAAADERIERSLDVLHEHALKVFQTVELAMSESDEVVRGYSNEEISSHEYDVSQRLKKIDESLPQVQSILLLDRKGHPLASSQIYPLPKGVDLSDRDYFQAQLADDATTYVSELLAPQNDSEHSYYFNLSRRRLDAAGQFTGVTSISVYPQHFEEFYKRLGRSPGSYYAMVRYDGVFLARYPVMRNRSEVLGPQSAIRRSIVHEPFSSIYTVVAQTDGIERRIGYRKLPEFPVYVLAGIETATMRDEWLALMWSQLIFGLPATLILFSIIGVALQRTRRLYAEAERREAAEGALRQAQRLEAIGQLTGGVAHDFNNLLMVVSGSVQRLRRELIDEKYTRFLDMITTATQRGESLTRQLLSFSRKQMLSPVIVDLSHHIPELKDLLHRSLRGDIEIKVDVPAELCLARVDLGELELAIINLAVNARDAMPKGGTLTIRVKPVKLRDEASADGLSGDFIAVRFSDTGIGMAPEVMPHVFEPFFTTKEVGKGTGLGLSQVYGFARQSGGTATVTSVPGAGTSVMIYLPRCEEAPQHVPAVAGDAARTACTGTVLIVEDNPDVTEVCSAYFDQLGYRARCVASSAAALDLLQADHSIDLVFSDILMPGSMNGLELGREIRRRHPNLPVVLSTGYSSSVQEALIQGFVVLPKPYTIDSLQRKLREATQMQKVRGGNKAPLQRSKNAAEPADGTVVS